MKSRTALSAFAVCVACVVLVPLTQCGGGGSGPTVPAPSAPAESRAPTPGKGSKDPDDINGDGYRDFMVPITGHNPVGVVYGSAQGLDPSTHTVYGRSDLGLPDPVDDSAASESVFPDTVADLDGDGFPDFVTTIMDKRFKDGQIFEYHAAPYVTWGGPGGPTAGAGASAVRLPQGLPKRGLWSVVRGDFDGDGHHDLAALPEPKIGQDESSLLVLYGPFTRSGAPARTETGPALPEGDLVVDAIDPSGKPRATSLLLHEYTDGSQSGNILYPARRGTGPSANGRRLRAGNAHAFGDFDGDGLRDVAVGDDGSRGDEPGSETEAPHVAGSLAVYPGSGGAPVKHRLPEVPEGQGTHYGPGGFVAADPDGDGHDGVLVATYEGATLIDGDKRTSVQRNVQKAPADSRRAWPVGAADFDGDGKDELILNWAADGLFGTYGENPTHWWITDGTTSRDQASFAATGLAPRAS
ncbi:FG-GAP repeat domain-containing protein [Streptomyces flaveus]|uniref:FG-GAP repeat domain-containing protein n=1 Tax=Streptomyces flaveus TaxID=66370 RepID=UPI0033221383